MRRTLKKDLKNLSKKDGQAVLMADWADKKDRFAFLVDNVLEFLFEAGMKNSAFPCCYFLFMTLMADV